MKQHSDIKIAATYIRVSTEEQTELSPASQLAEIRKWADTHGYTVPDQYVFADEGISGRKVVGRDAFREMIGTAKRTPKPFDAILLWKFSRFARNRDDAVFYKSILRKQLGIDVISIKEPIAEGKLGIITEALIEAMDEYYSINLAEEVKRGMEEKHRRGELQSAPAFGYAAQDNVLVPIPAEAACVQEMFRRCSLGESCLSISKWLNAIGVRTHRGNPFENRTVAYILRNPVYIGKLRWNPAGRSQGNVLHSDAILADGRHPPLVSQELWQAVQERLDAVRNTHTAHSRSPSVKRDWDSGLIRCARCGATMVFTKPHFLRCNNYVRGRCSTSQHIRSDLLKAALCSRIRHDLTTGQPIHYTLVHPKTPDRITALLTQKTQLEKKLVRLRESYLMEIDTAEEYRAAKCAVQAQLDAVTQELKTEPQDSASETCADAIAHALKDPILDSAAVEQLAAAAQSILVRVLWDKENRLLTLHYRIV